MKLDFLRQLGLSDVRLEPTYEGLKLHCAGVSLGATPRLEPTYEGLKRAMDGEPGQRVVCLEPTYEGLKLSEHALAYSEEPRLEPTYEGLKPLTPELACR